MSSQAIDIRPDHASMVRDILVARLPEGVSVWVFGSRATGQARPYSDLDLALQAAEPLSAAIIHDLADDFTECDLPFKVDVLDLNRVASSFRKRIDKSKMMFSLEDTGL